jgi:hypothetical protein
MQTRFANPESITNLHMGALIVLGHFHYCNKGKLPFRLADSYGTLQQLKKIAELDDEQTMFVRNTSLYVHTSRKYSKSVLSQKYTHTIPLGDDYTKARDSLNFGHDLYFVSQMFDEQWAPTAIG